MFLSIFQKLAGITSHAELCEPLRGHFEQQNTFGALIELVTSTISRCVAQTKPNRAAGRWYLKE